MKPIVFVAMPFGKKKDPETQIEIDFDDIYEKAIKPLNDDSDLNVDIVRADEEKINGIIHRPMYERLLLAEYVIADVSIHNPNVFYELGVRHCAKPMTTIIIFSTPLPFDIQFIRSIKYDLNKGKLPQKEANILKSSLKEKLLQAKSNKENDSPIFELIPELKSTIHLPENLTKSFKERALKVDKIRNELKEIVCVYKVSKDPTLREYINEIRKSLGAYDEIHEALLIDILRSYKAIEAYEEMIETIKSIPAHILNSSLRLKQYYAFALNRTQTPQNIERAKSILSEALVLHGQDSETLGLLGRIYKDLYKNTDVSRSGEKQGYLDKAIETYLRGFYHDPRDFYPGINAVNLLFAKGDDTSIKKMNDIITCVNLAINRINKDDMDYWTVASIVECLLLKKDWLNAKQVTSQLVSTNEAPWKYKTTSDNLLLLRKTFANREIETDTIDYIIEQLEQKVIK